MLFLLKDRISLFWKRYFGLFQILQNQLFKQRNMLSLGISITGIRNIAKKQYLVPPVVLPAALVQKKMSDWIKRENVNMKRHQKVDYPAQKSY